MLRFPFIEMSPARPAVVHRPRYPGGVGKPDHGNRSRVRCAFDPKLSPTCHLRSQDSASEDPMLKPLAFFAVIAAFSLGCTRTDDAKPSAGGAASGAPAAQAEKSNITVKGSDTMVILGQRWAEAYM